MKNGPLVSVIIPVFNVAPYLAESLDSVINQTYKNLEIIIIDDGSTDSSGFICEKYKRKDNRIRLVHEENKGLSAARNVGLSLKTGRAVAFLDPDDVYQLSFIEKMVSAMLAEKADLVVCKYTHFHKRAIIEHHIKKKPSISSKILGHDDALRALADGELNHAVWNKLYDNKLWDNIRFPDGHVYEDIDTSFRVINLAKRIYTIDNTLYLCRRRRKSITTHFTCRNAKDWLLARSHFDSFIKNNAPEIFSNNQLQERYQSLLKGMIGICLKLKLQKSNKNTVFCSKLEKRILSLGKTVTNRNCRFLLKVYYRMFCYYPTLLECIYKQYDCIRLKKYKY